MERNIADLRKEYTKLYLKKEELNDNPFVQFSMWFEEAEKAKVMEVNAMTLSTVSEEGKPASRIVLLKGIEEDKFVFYTNYNSNKGKEMEQNPYVALNFFWPELERQVRVEGKIQKASAEQSDRYFHSRPTGSQLGAWASPQSKIIENREVMEARQKEYEEKFKGQQIPRPEHWGGYCVDADRMEFWQGRPSRLHDRFLYIKENNSWKIERLAP